jgi:N-acetylmuramoyl-L-alanine amidase
MLNKRLIFITFSVIFFIISFAGYAAPIKITHIQVSTTQKENYITIKLSSESQPHIFTLSKPDRLVLDFTNTQLAIKLNKSQLNHSIIKNIRDGYPAPKTVRLVFDLAAPIHFKTISKLPTKLVIISFFVTPLKPIILKKEKPTPRSDRPVVISHITQKKSTLLPLPLHHATRPMIVMIDPGHGGKDTGAIGDMHTKEKDVVLQIAKQLANLINLQNNMRAVLTRNGDYYVTLHNRLVYARKNKADIFISIHADSYFNNRASGVSVYTLSKNGATSIATRWLTMRNNYSELEGVELKKLEDQSTLLRSVLIDLAQTDTVKNSFRLGSSLLDALDKVTLLHSTRVEKAPFMVLKSPDIPSVLAEVGFISNPSEELHLANKLYQHKMAVALFNGIQTYQKKYLTIL